ncbi:DUF1080 domain-containing protein, partial [Durusdinium trenchii]
EGFVPLFDGESLDGWIGATDAYTVEEGCISSLPDKSGNLYTAGQYANFVLRFEFQLDPGANNGIGLRVPYGGRASYEGFEIQLLDDDADRYAKLNPYQFCGSVYGIIPAKRGALKPAGEWNSLEIRLDGRDIRITMNGTVIVDGNLDEASTPQTLDGKDHPGLNQTTGWRWPPLLDSDEFRESRSMDGQNLAAEPTGYLRDFRRLIDPPIQRTAAWTEAITRLRFVVEQGRSDALVGPRGSGKSTLLRELAIDLERAGWRTSRIDLTGMPGASLAPRIADSLGLGLPPQTPLSQVWRTVTEYCEGLRRCELTRVLILDHVDQCLPDAVEDLKRWLRISAY